MTDEQKAMIDLMNGPRGGVLQVPGEAMKFWVKGSDNTYLVTLANEDALDARDTCECSGWGYRGSCYHLTQATRQWQRDRPKLQEFVSDEERERQDQELRRLFA